MTGGRPTHEPVHDPPERVGTLAALVMFAVLAGLLGFVLQPFPGADVWLRLQVWVVTGSALGAAVIGVGLVAAGRRRAGVVVVVTSGALALPGVVQWFAMWEALGTAHGRLLLLRGAALVAAGAVAWGTRDPGDWSWDRVPSAPYVVAAAAMLLGEVLPRTGVVTPGGERLGWWSPLHSLESVAAASMVLSSVIVAAVLVFIARAPRRSAGAAALVVAVPSALAQCFELARHGRGWLPLEEGGFGVDIVVTPVGWASLVGTLVVVVLGLRWSFGAVARSGQAIDDRRGSFPDPR